MTKIYRVVVFTKDGSVTRVAINKAMEVSKPGELIFAPDYYITKDEARELAAALREQVELLEQRARRAW